MSQNAVLPVLRKRQDLSSLPLNLPHSMVLKAVWNTPEPSQNCLPMFAWVTCVVPAGLFAAWPPRLKLKKKRSKNDQNAYTLAPSSFKHWYIDSYRFNFPVSIWTPFEAILQCPDQAKGTQGDQLRFGVGSAHDLSKGLAKLWQKQGKGDQKKKLVLADIWRHQSNP